MHPQPYPPVPQGPGGPPPGPAGEVRPARFWYAVAAAILVIAIAIPVAVYVAGRLSAPTVKELGIGVARAELDPAEDQALYVSKPRSLTPPPCTLNGPGQVVISVYRPITEVSADGTNWYAILRVHATAKGTYTMTCLGPPGGLRLGIGAVPAARPGVLATLALNVLVPLAGVLAGGVLALVVLVRRRRALQLLAAGGGYPGPGGYAAGGPPPYRGHVGGPGGPGDGYQGPAYDPPPDPYRGPGYGGPGGPGRPGGPGGPGPGGPGGPGPGGPGGPGPGGPGGPGPGGPPPNRPGW